MISAVWQAHWVMWSTGRASAQRHVMHSGHGSALSWDAAACTSPEIQLCMCGIQRAMAPRHGHEGGLTAAVGVAEHCSVAHRGGGHATAAVVASVA